MTQLEYFITMLNDAGESYIKDICSDTIDVGVTTNTGEICWFIFDKQTNNLKKVM